jgi:hypothetical protein
MEVNGKGVRVIDLSGIRLIPKSGPLVGVVRLKVGGEAYVIRKEDKEKADGGGDPVPEERRDCGS